MRAYEILTEAGQKTLQEKWSKKYKSSINCSHPKGFSQKAHCAGKKKHNESVETELVCEDCGMCQTHGSLNEIAKGAKDSNGVTKCWPGKHAAGTKKGKNGGQVRNCVPNEGYSNHPSQRVDPRTGKRYVPPKSPLGQGVAEEAKHGLYYNVNKRKKAGTSRPASSPKAPTAQAWKDAAKTAKKEGVEEAGSAAQQAAIAVNMKKQHKKPKNEDVYSEEELNLLFDSLEEMFESMGIHEDNFEAFTDENILSEAAAWQKKSGKNKNGGLNKKGVASYRREHPGSKLQTAVTTKPSKLKKGSKASKRRKSFCARMKGMKKSRTGAKTKRDPNSRINKSLRKWNC